MSSTNRGAKRRTNDDYPTPGWVTRAILPYLSLWGRILEPACGEGAIVRELLAAGASDMLAFDLHRSLAEDLLASAGGWTGGPPAVDFFDSGVPAPHDLIITNPPYRLALEFVQRAIELRAQGGTVCMLLRLNFLGSQKRAPWMRENMPQIYILPKRPSFTGKGTDSCEYAWMVWRDGVQPGAPVLLDIAPETAKEAA